MSATRINTLHETKRPARTKSVAHGTNSSIKPAKPTKWGAQLLVKMEALRKALAAQA